MCERHKRALAMAERTVVNIRTAVVRCERLPFGLGSEQMQHRMAEQYARDAELLDTWTYIWDLLRNGKALP